MIGNSRNSNTDDVLTPFFKTMKIKNLNQTEIKGRDVYDDVEVVEIRIAGRNDYVPVFPITEEYVTEDGDKVIWPERFKEQYNAHVNGDTQRAKGAPLELLVDYGITHALIGLCRAVNIYTIEALHATQGRNLKGLGMNAGILKEAASQFMADRSDKTEVLDELEALRRRIAELEGHTEIVEEVPSEEEVADMVEAVESDENEKAELRAEYTRVYGSPPRGNPSVETLRTRIAEKVDA